MRTNEEELDLFADLLEPCAEILSDKEFIAAIQGNGKKITAVKVAIKNHKKAVIEILALLDGVPVEEYHVNILALPIKLLELLNRPEVTGFLAGQGQKTDAAYSGSATANTEDGAN